MPDCLVFVLLQADAEKQYIDVVTKLVASDANAENLTTAAPAGAWETLLCEDRDNMSIITFNRPNKKNAFSTKVLTFQSPTIENGIGDHIVFGDFRPSHSVH